MRRYKIAILGMIFALIGVFGYISNSYAGMDIILASAARTTATNSVDIYRTTETGIHVIFTITAQPGSGSITPEIDAKDSLGNYYPILIGTALTTTGTTILKVGPGIGAVSNGASADMLPDIYRVHVSVANSASYTYSVTINSGNAGGR